MSLWRSLLILLYWCPVLQPNHYDSLEEYDDVIKWKHFPHNWPFFVGKSPVNSPHKGQWRGALIFSLICAWINGWVNNREAGDLRRHRAHYDITVMGNSRLPRSSNELQWLDNDERVCRDSSPSNGQYATCVNFYLFNTHPPIPKHCVSKLGGHEFYLGRALHWRHNVHDCVSNHQPHDCLLERLFRRRSKKTSKLRVTGLCAGNSPGPVNSPHKWPVTRKMSPFDDVIMSIDTHLRFYVIPVASMAPNHYLDQYGFISNESLRRYKSAVIR